MTRKLFGHIVFYCWVVVFLVYYIFGNRGLLVGYTYSRDISGVEAEIKQLEWEMKELKYEIDLWQLDPFYKEQVAREQLQLARPGDIIYYISE